MVDPPFLSIESKRRSTHSTKSCQQSQVLGKRALILVNQIFLLWQSCRVLCPTWNNLLSAIWLWLSAKRL
jgi:hypothetical protein